MDKHILETIQYFSRFDYPPTLDEIFIFLPQKIEKKDLEKKVGTLLKNKKLLKNGPKYTTREYLRMIRQNKKRKIWSEQKRKKVDLFIKFLSVFPQVKLIGFSGSVAMMNAKRDDDIDLFIVTHIDRIWTSRFIALVLASVLGQKRKRGVRDAPDKVCLNLFFDESGLQIAKKKQTEYIGHEILQMKPVINKNSTYERFLEANSWVFNLFPNARSIRSIPNFFVSVGSSSHSRSPKSQKNWYLHVSIGNIFEWLFKNLQLYLIKRHRTTEIITDKQLWFFPEDFEEILKKKPSI